jgi:hypothetical protein
LDRIEFFFSRRRRAAKDERSEQKTERDYSMRFQLASS